MGAFPETYDIHKLRFYVFHARRAVVKVVLGYLRKLLEVVPRNIKIMGFLLSKIKGWDGYTVDPWLANENNNNLLRRHKKFHSRNTQVCEVIL